MIHQGYHKYLQSAGICASIFEYWAAVEGRSILHHVNVSPRHFTAWVGANPGWVLLAAVYTHVRKGAWRDSITRSLVVEGEARTFRLLRTGCRQATNCILQYCWAGHLLFASSLLPDVFAVFSDMLFPSTIVTYVGTWADVGKEFCP